MSPASLAELKASAAAAEDPGFAPEGITRFGGVDPLGLRQINFDVMDELLLGLNNVARHIKPFVLVTWAWRRAQQQSQSLAADTIKQDALQDFVDRIEVIYVWSQLLRDPNVDLPGKQFLAPLVSASTVNFSGPTWEQRRKTRRYSTALSAPIYYGPGLKALGWLQPLAEYPAVMVPRPAVAPALDAFEAQLGAMLDHEAFNKFGSVIVSSDEARSWADRWAIDDITDAEAEVMREMLVGSTAPSRRRSGGELALAAANVASTSDVALLRAAMTGPPSAFVPAPQLLDTPDKWRRLQVRQLFRLSLEALFYWTLGALPETTGSIDALVRAFVQQTPRPLDIASAEAWIAHLVSAAEGPTELMTRIVRALDEPSAGDLAFSIAAGLALCLSEESTAESRTQQHDRLPLYRAQQEAAARSLGTVEELLQHVLESWVLAQHTYWSVGRGLADARAGGKTLLRLKIILDEGGWGVTPGAPLGRPPQPTPDRLQTFISLGHECGLFSTQH
jgi:hypothetical protein